MTRKVKAEKRSGRAVQGGRAAAPIVASNLALVMREVYEFWTGAPVADAALREYRALLAVAKECRETLDWFEQVGALKPGEVGVYDWTEDEGALMVIGALRRNLDRLARASRTEGGRP
jgi:hypothetical protein